MIIFSLLYGLLIIGIGFLIKKSPNLISGYNTMSTVQKRNVDIEAIAATMKKGMIIIGLTTMVSTVALFLLDFPTVAFIALIAPLLFGLLALMIVIQKYDYNKQSWFKRYFAAILISVIIVIVASFMVHGALPTKAILQDDGVEFTGQYGVTIQYDQITKVELIKKIPAIKTRTNGLGLGNILKGDFTLDGFGRCRLFLRLPNSPYLYLETKDGKKTIFNSEDPSYTDSIYQKLSKTLGNDKDAHGCIGSAGYTWSELRQDCIRVWEEGVSLLPIADYTVSAYAVFSSDSSRVELFLPDGSKPEILDRRTLPNGGTVWNVEDDDTRNLRKINGKWQISQRGNIIYLQK